MSEKASAYLKLGSKQRDMMNALRDSGPFEDGLAACRLAVVLSLMCGGKELPLEEAHNVYNRGTFDDEDNALATAVADLTGTDVADVYPKMSRMANWGVTAIHEALRGDDISIHKLLADIQK